MSAAIEDAIDNNFKVPLTTIRDIEEHSNAHSLEIAICYGWKVVVSKGTYHIGQMVFYIPPKSLLPQWLEDYLFPPDAKIKLTKHRIKAIKIRGQISEGMIVKVEDVLAAAKVRKVDTKLIENQLVLEQDYSQLLGITKYIPPSLVPVEQRRNNEKGDSKKKKSENAHFHKYGGLNNINWYPDLFEEGESVYVTEKIHGTNFRAGWVPAVHKGFWAKLKNFFKSLVGRSSAWEFVYGSNNVQLQSKKYGKNNFYDKNFYLEAVENYNLKSKLRFGEVIYGEIYGLGVQKGYDYGLKDCRHVAFFDMREETPYSSEWMSIDRFNYICKTRGLPMVPVVYQGRFNKEEIAKLVSGPSLLDSNQKVREGIVIKNYCDYFENRKALKWISPEYLMREVSGETSDFQ